VDLLDGAQDVSRRVWGCYIHGLFDNDAFRRRFLADVRAAFNLPALEPTEREGANPYERLADAFEQHIDMALLEKILDRGA
jgi:adenosylcobyric acid synthase